MCMQPTTALVLGELCWAVIDPAKSAVLWVADPTPRPQAFYRKHGFVEFRHGRRSRTRALRYGLGKRGQGWWTFRLRGSGG